MEERFDCTTHAISIFGDIVECAYCLKPSWVDDDEDYNYMPDVEDESIEPKDSNPVFVRFKNGKSFKIWSSEWGGVQSISEDNYIKSVRL